jgi:hypothetical protein
MSYLYHPLLQWVVCWAGYTVTAWGGTDLDLATYIQVYRNSYIYGKLNIHINEQKTAGKTFCSL